MVRHTLKILQQMLQDFLSVSDHFGTLCIKRLKYMGPCLNSLSLNFPNTWWNDHIKLRIMATFENCKIFSTYYFSNVRGYKAALKDGNYWTLLIVAVTTFLLVKSCGSNICHSREECFCKSLVVYFCLFPLIKLYACLHIT